MVFRLPIQYIAMIVGVLLCVVSVNAYPQNMNDEAMTYDLPFDILIIDPGHGGLDGGAVTVDGVKESEINLSISLKLNALCHLYGIPTVMTRTDEAIDYPSDAVTISECKKADQEMRLRLIRDYPHGILFSIHQNYYPSERVSGVQVLYGHDEKSRELGALLQAALCNSLCPNCRRVAAEVEDNIYLMKHCGCVSALIECGFLSNQAEGEQLQNDSYQTKIASVLLYGYLQYTAQNKK